MRRFPRLQANAVAAVCAAVLAACGGTQATSDRFAGEGVVSLALNAIPSDVNCVTVTVASSTRSVTRSVPATPGQSLISQLSSLPTGSVAVTVLAYSTACTAVTASSVPTWFADPVTVTLVPGVPLALTVQERHNGVLGLTVDFVDDCATLVVSGFSIQSTSNGTYTRQGSDLVWSMPGRTIKYGQIDPTSWEVLQATGGPGPARPALCTKADGPGNGPFDCTSGWREWGGSGPGFVAVNAKFTCQ